MDNNISYVKNLLDRLEKEYMYLKSNNLFNSQHKKISFAGQQYHYNYQTASKLINKRYNRYTDILAHDETRYQSTCVPYINANCVKDRYILAQGPIKTAIDTFWIMAFESGSDMIVCLTKQVENNAVKYDKYFDDNDTMTFSDVSVNVTSKKESNTIILRKIQVTYQNNKKMFYHVQYLDWPDHGLPSNANSFDNLLTLINKVNNHKPLIVHCSAGVGRTGTLVTIMEIISWVEKLLGLNQHGSVVPINSLSISTIIHQLRFYRASLVQNHYQLEFCYIMVINLIKKLINCYEMK